MQHLRIASFALVALIIVMPVSALGASEGSFDDASTELATKLTRPTLTGEASGTKTIRILIENGKGKDIVRSNVTKVKEGEWKVRVGKALPVGNYVVTLFGAGGLKKDTIATTSLTILPKSGATTSSSKSTLTKGSLNVSMIPLLMGGNATHGASVPVAYIKVSNPGTSAVTIDGFTLTETGSAPDGVVIGFSTNDDKGGSRFQIGGTEGAQQFKNGSAYVALPASISPGSVRIFTIKAILSKDSGVYFGKQLKIDVAGVETNAAVQGTFPIRGTTWTLVY